MPKFFVIYVNTVHEITADYMEVSESSCRFYTTGLPVNPVEAKFYESILVAKYSKYLACFSAASVDWRDNKEDVDIITSNNLATIDARP